jgi:circadian clock protein KaiB
MKTKKKTSTTKVFEKALATRFPSKCLLRLYVAGATPRSRLAILRARQLCETEFNGNWELEVIDVYQQPILASDGQIVATPTLVRVLPTPVRRFIGDLANITRLFAGLNPHVIPSTKR